MNKILKVTALLLIFSAAAMANRPVAIAVIGVKPSIPNALEIISDEVMAAFSNGNEYEPYERTKEVLAALGGEHKFQQSSGLVPDNEIRKMGKMLGVDYMCLIQSRQFGKEFSLNARLVHIESGKVENAANVASSLANLSELYKNSGELACKLLKNCGSENSKASEWKSPTVSSDNDPANAGNTFVDSRDGKKYRTVKIGDQIWMAENLNYNADGSKCYGNDIANCDRYGRLYDWNTAKKACPSGWHLPYQNEWQKLLDFAGGNKIAGKKLKVSIGWDRRGGGTDALGFSALPGGYYNATSNDFILIGVFGNWWSANEHYNKSDVYIMYIKGFGDSAENGAATHFPKNNLFSVRCLQNVIKVFSSSSTKNLDLDDLEDLE